MKNFKGKLINLQELFKTTKQHFKNYLLALKLRLEIQLN